MKRLAMLAAVMMLAACDRGVDLRPEDPKYVYLEKNLPHLKIVRDQLAAEHNVCAHNIAKLNELLATFHHEESKFLLQRKIGDFRSVRDSIRHQIDCIDTEVEHGIAAKEINTLEGGGTFQRDVSKILMQSNLCLKTAKNVNASAARLYATSADEQPMKVVPVTPYLNQEERPPKVVPVNRNHVNMSHASR